jgi:hypothetical protein
VCMPSNGTDLIWQPTPAPSDLTVGDVNTLRVDPSHLGMAQDVIIGKDGSLRSRGGLVKAAADHTGIPMALIQSVSNTAMVSYDSTNFNALYGSSNSTLTSFNKITIMGEDSSTSSQKITATNVLYRWNSLKMAPDVLGTVNAGGLFNGAQFLDSGKPYLSSFIWGGSLSTSNTSTGTFTAATTSALLGGVGTSWTSALVGTYVFVDSGGGALLYYGQVKSVDSTTQITLTEKAYFGTGGSTPIFKTSRTLRANVYKGRVTCSTASATVVGSNTKWANSSPNKNSGNYLSAPGGWVMYRASDGASIGVVSAVVNDTTITLSAVASVNCTNENYVLRPSNVLLAANGFSSAYISAACSEVYADRYFYGCVYTNDGNLQMPLAADPRTWCTAQITSSIVFTNKYQPEQFDLDPKTGDIITLPSISGYGEEIRALKAMRGGMLIFRGTETYFLTGYSPETFRVVKILNDGCLGANCVKKYKDGVIWAGYEGIWYFDGTRVTDLLESRTKDLYRRTAPQIGITDCGSAIAYDHFMLSYKLPASFTWPYNNTTTTATGVTYCVNMLNGAVSFFTNLHVYNSVDYLLSGTAESVIIGGNGSALSATIGQFLKGSTLFVESTVATDNIDAAIWFQTVSNNLGPQVMFETVKYAMGDATRLKFWKRFLMNYSSDKAMTMMASGTNYAGPFPNTATGTASTDSIAVNSTNSILKRMRFLVRAPSCFVRVYQTATPVAANSQKFKMYWYAIGGKRMRQGRVQP